MEKAQVLVRQVARAFYKTDHVVVIDALVNHIALNVESLRTIFVSTGRNKSDLLKLIGRLREGGLVSMHSRLETKANAQKPTTVEYFFIDYRRAIDATKYRLHILENNLRSSSAPDKVKKELLCPKCKSEWTLLEAMDKEDYLHLGNSGFLCHKCGNPLDYVEIDPEATESRGVLGAFNDQFGWLVELLREIDNSTIPEVTGEGALEDAVPVPVEKAPLERGGYESTAVAVMPSAVRGMVTGPEKVEISISTNSEVTAAQQAAAAELKERLAAQNQLPEWHTRSTVRPNEMTAAGQREEVARREREVEASKLVANGGEDQKTVAESSLDDIFAQLENDARAKMAEEDEEDEDEEFEDVIPDAPLESKKIKLEDTNGISSGNGTPAALEEDSDAEEFEDA